MLGTHYHLHARHLLLICDDKKHTDCSQSVRYPLINVDKWAHKTRSNYPLLLSLLCQEQWLDDFLENCGQKYWRAQLPIDDDNASCYHWWWSVFFSFFFDKSSACPMSLVWDKHNCNRLSDTISPSCNLYFWCLFCIFPFASVTFPL